MKHPNRSPWPFVAKLTALVVFALLCVTAVLYARGVFDISFINRNAGATSDEENEYDTLAPLETAPPPSVTSPDRLENPPVTVEASSVTFEDAAALSAAGSVRDGVGLYSADIHVLALAAPAVELPNVYSYRQMWEQVEVAVPGEEGGYATATEYQLTDRRTITLYAGYIIYDCGGTLYLCDAAGQPLATFADSDLVPAYCYSSDGSPLFLHSGRYCIYDDTRKMLVEQNDNQYLHAVENIGLYFDHAPDYGRGAGEVRYRNDKWKWSFINSSNDEVFKYYGLYNFSESLAAAIELKLREVTTTGEPVTMTVEGGYVVADADGNPKIGMATIVREERNYELNFLSTTGATALTGDKTYLDASGRAVIASWQLPLFTRGNRAMGYLYFDHGLCRVRETTQDLYAENRVILSDTDYIIRNDGSRFPLPAGYSVVSYSNGMILLERDGKYGFMNYEGTWVVQPVYASAEPYFEGLAVVGLENGKKAMLDTQGNVVIPFAYSHISNASSGLIALYDESIGWQILYKMTK